MKLVFLYGPPASGKYTIGKALAEASGYALFHNHATIDFLKSVLPYGSPGFFELLQKIRLDIFEEAAKQNIPGLIFTYVYEKDSDDPFIHEVVKRVTAHGGELVFIQLYCEKDELLKRVTLESRNQFHKVKTEEGLSRSLERNEVTAPIAFVKSTKIDNTRLSVEETVQKALGIVNQP